MLTRVLAMTLCLSVTSRCSIERAGRIEPVFGVGLLSVYPTLFCKRNSSNYKNKIFFLGLCPKLRTLENFATASRNVFKT